MRYIFFINRETAMYQTVFQRYEKKYIIGPEQYRALMERFEGKMERDR
jgi:hypothetical protein